MTRFVVAISIVVALASTMPARAAANLEIAPALGSKVGFVFPVVAAVKAQPITFLQVDGNASHNMVSAVDDGEGGYKILYGPDGAPWCQGFAHGTCPLFRRSEERRVGKECRSRWSPY